jgi:hypothetical protein
VVEVVHHLVCSLDLLLQVTWLVDLLPGPSRPWAREEQLNNHLLSLDNSGLPLLRAKVDLDRMVYLPLKDLKLGWVVPLLLFELLPLQLL